MSDGHRYTVAVCRYCREQLSTDADGELDPCMTVGCSGVYEHVRIELFVTDVHARLKIAKADAESERPAPPLTPEGGTPCLEC